MKRCFMKGRVKNKRRTDMKCSSKQTKEEKAWIEERKKQRTKERQQEENKKILEEHKETKEK